MSLALTFLLLSAAAMHAVWNALVKSSWDRLRELAILNLCAGGIAALTLPFTGFPALAALPFLAGTMLFHAGYYFFLLKAYREGGLSHVYPIARGTSPLLVVLLSGWLLHEPLATGPIAGVLLIAASILSLALGAGSFRRHGRATVFALATGVTIAGYTMTDGAGARLAGNPLSYPASMFVLNAFPLLLVLPFSHRRPRPPEATTLRLWLRGGLGGALSLGSYGLVVWAMTVTEVAPVAAIRETSVVLAAVIGTVFLGEPFGRHRVIASIGVAAGIVLLRS